MLSSSRLGLRLGRDRRLAAFDHVLWPAHLVRRVDRENMADDGPVEQHADRGEVLFLVRPGCSCSFNAWLPASDTFSDSIYAAAHGTVSISTSPPMPCCSSQAKMAAKVQQARSTRFCELSDGFG
jgi:hypothetical protein